MAATLLLIPPQAPGAGMGAPTARRQAGEIVRLRQEGVRPSEIAIRLGIGRASVYRVLGEQKNVAA